MGGKHPNQAFTAFVPPSSVAQLSNPQQYEGKTVAVSGKDSVVRGQTGNHRQLAFADHD